MPENPYEPSRESQPQDPASRQKIRYVAYAVMLAGLFELVHGGVAFYFRFNFITGTRYGASFMPLYMVAAGIGICVLGLAIKTYADRKP